MTSSQIRRYVVLLGLLLAATALCADGGKEQGDAIPMTLVPGYTDQEWSRRLAWLLDVLSHRADIVTEAELREQFAPSYLDQTTIWETKERVAWAAKLAPFVLTDMKQLEPTRGVGFLHTPLGPRRMVVGIDRYTGKIVEWSTGAYIHAPLDDILAWLPRLVTKAQVLAAELDGAGCHPLYALNQEEALAVGSVAKLYILLALAGYIAEGNASWQTSTPIRDEWKNSGSGRMELEAAGTLYSLRQMAEAMISSSDNTATDHILGLIGRERVEQAIVATRAYDPYINSPFLSTKEIFRLRRLDESDRMRYIALPVDEKRNFLERELTLGEARAKKRTTRGIDQVGWFASASDLCNLVVMLRERPEAAPLIDMLTLFPHNRNSGLSEKDWPYIGGKDGWLIEAQSMLLLLRRHDGREFFVSVTINDPANVMDGKLAKALAWRIADELLDE